MHQEEDFHLVGRPGWEKQEWMEKEIFRSDQQQAMKAFVLREYNRPMEMEERELPLLGDDDVLVRVKACGICQTDLKIFRGEIPPPIVTLPHIPGHEIAGELVGVGAKVTRVQPGDVGVLYIYIACRECEWCLSGEENLCPDLKRIGFELEGGFAQFVRAPSYAFCPIEKKVPFEEMAILPDAVATAYRAVTRLGEVRAGQRVLIVGAGGLGIHGVQIAKLSGASVLVADQREEALNLARQFGADFSIDVKAEPMESVMELTRGKGVDSVIEFVGSKESLSWSLRSLKKGGKLVIVGYAPGQPFPLDTMAMHYNEWELKGARLSTKAELLQVIRLVEQGRVKPVVSQTFPFEQANEALRTLQQGGLLGRLALTF